MGEGGRRNSCMGTCVLICINQFQVQLGYNYKIPVAYSPNVDVLTPADHRFLDVATLKGMFLT